MGQVTGNIYLWGRPGTGKSHLLQAVCTCAQDNYRTAAYIPFAQLDEFTPELLHGLESLDLVCIDDLGRIAGRNEWETALFHLFNRMREANRSMIFAARQGPLEIALGLQDLKSRLSWDLGYYLTPLDDESVAIALKQRAGARMFDLPDEVVSYIVSRVARDTHNLFRLLDQLDDASLASQKKLTIPFVKRLIDTGLAK